MLQNHGLEYEIASDKVIRISFSDNEQLFNILSLVNNDPNIEIEIKKPNLDEAFLNLTGKRITAEGLAK